MNFGILTKDAGLARRIEDALVLCRADGEAFADEIDMLRTLRRKAYELIVIDSRATDAASSAVVSWRACQARRSTPLLVVGSFADPVNLFRWYEAGATDIVSLQFNANEFYLRATRAVLSNASPAARERRPRPKPRASEKPDAPISPV